MSFDRSRRYRFVLLALVGLVVVAAGGLAGAGTYALFGDSETDDAGTISIVKNNQANVQFKSNCRKAEVSPDDPTAFDMIVRLVDGRSDTYNQSDFTTDQNGEFTYETKNHWPGNPGPQMSNVTLDGVTYHSTCG